MFYNAGANL